MKNSNLKTKVNNMKGITLVALVISIIVLLILATVSINLVINNGILDKAKSAVDKYSDGEIGEQIKLAYQEYQMAQFTGANLSAKDFIKNKLNDIYGEGEITDVEKSGSALIITFANGKIYTYNSSKGTMADLTNKTNISKSTNENFVGYYADIDADGTIDGVIFADLLVGNTNGNEWGNENGTYEISTKSADILRDYYISKENHDGIFGVEDVLSPKGGGEDRFYVMQIDDFGSYYWYKNGAGKMTPLVTYDSFGSGRTNTGAMIEKWNTGGTSEGYSATKDNEDIWKHIQAKYSEGWFIPSRAEWAAFLNEMNGNQHITSSNYIGFELQGTYMSSSQISKHYVWRIRISINSIDNRTPSEKYMYRLATTF